VEIRGSSRHDVFPSVDATTCTAKGAGLVGMTRALGGEPGKGGVATLDEKGQPIAIFPRGKQTGQGRSVAARQKGRQKGVLPPTRATCMPHVQGRDPGAVTEKKQERIAARDSGALA